MSGALTDHLLTQMSARPGARRRSRLDSQVGAHVSTRLSARLQATALGPVWLHDSATPGPCLLLVPDGPNVIEHYAELVARLRQQFRVVCFDMPGFGHSLPGRHHDHSLDAGAAVVIAVLDALGIEAASLAFSCANGFYALHAARLAPSRIKSIVLSQTPSLGAMQAWTDRVVPAVLKAPVLGQLLAHAARRKMARAWYKAALPVGGPWPPSAHRRSGRWIMVAASAWLVWSRV